MTAKPIPVTNIEAITREIKDAEGNATARTLTADNIADAALEAEGILKSAGIPKTMWQGVVVHVNPHAVPNSYQYTAQATMATLVRRSRDWAVVAVRRGTCTHNSYGIGRSLASRVTIDVPAAQVSPLLSSVLNAHGITINPISADA